MDLQTVTFQRDDDASSLTIQINPESKLIDLRRVAQECGLHSDRLRLRVGPDDADAKIVFELFSIKIDQLFSACKRKRDQPLLILVERPGVPVSFTANRKHKTFPPRPSYEEVCAWLEGLDEELQALEFSFQITCNKQTPIDVSSKAEYDRAMEFLLRAETGVVRGEALQVSLSVKKGAKKSYSTFAGDKGVEDAMKLLMGPAWDAANEWHSMPMPVDALEEYPPYSLTPHLQDALPMEYTAGESETVDGAINMSMRQLAAAYAACGLSAVQSEATKRAFIDPILMLVCTIAASLRKMKPSLLQLCMEFSVDQATCSGKIDYVIRYLMSLISFIEAKGEGGLAAYRGQTLAELSAIKESNVSEGKKRNWDETQLPAAGVLTNSSDWEFYVYRPSGDPPVVYKVCATPVEMLWKDLAKLRERFMPVIEQILAIVLSEIDHVHELQAAKKRRTGP